MGLTGALFGVSKQVCPHCKLTYGEVNGKKGHSKKQFMKCLYTANVNLYNAVIENNILRNELAKLKNPSVEPTENKNLQDGITNG